MNTSSGNTNQPGGLNMKRILASASLSLILSLGLASPGLAQTKTSAPGNTQMSPHAQAVKKCNDDYKAAVKKANADYTAAVKAAATTKGKEHSDAIKAASTAKKDALAAARKAKADCLNAAPK
jgi:hypothetical protein